MNRLFKTTAFLFAVLSLSIACKQEPASDEPGQEEEPAQEIISDAQVVSSSGLPVVDNGTGQVSPQTMRIIENLTTDFWYVEQWVEINQGKPGTKRENRGLYFQFSEDGTMKYGKLNTEQGVGTWIYDPQQAYITMEFPAQQNMEYSVKLASDGKVMLWVGTERYNQNNIQMKLENYVEQMAQMPDLSN